MKPGAKAPPAPGVFPIRAGPPMTRRAASGNPCACRRPREPKCRRRCDRTGARSGMPDPVRRRQLARGWLEVVPDAVSALVNAARTPGRRRVYNGAAASPGKLSSAAFQLLCVYTPPPPCSVLVADTSLAMHATTAPWAPAACAAPPSPPSSLCLLASAWSAVSQPRTWLVSLGVYIHSSTPHTY